MQKNIFFRIDCVLIAISFAIAMYVSSNSVEYIDSMGICLITQDKQIIVVVDDLPIILSNMEKNQDLLNSLKTGDKIILTHTKISQSYPAQTNAYKISKLEENCLFEIADDVLNSVYSLGYLIS